MQAIKLLKYLQHTYSIKVSQQLLYALRITIHKISQISKSYTLISIKPMHPNPHFNCYTPMLKKQVDHLKRRFVKARKKKRLMKKPWWYRATGRAFHEHYCSIEEKIGCFKWRTFWYWGDQGVRGSFFKCKSIFRDLGDIKHWRRTIS